MAKKTKTKTKSTKKTNNINTGIVTVNGLSFTPNMVNPMIPNPKNNINGNNVKFDFNNKMLNDNLYSIYDNIMYFNSVYENELFEPYHSLSKLLNTEINLKCFIHDTKSNVVCFFIYKNFNIISIDCISNYSNSTYQPLTITCKFKYEKMEYYPVANKREARKIKFKNNDI